jgi:hypothetical protein
VDEHGLSVELSLGLAEGHRNLAWNLMRMPHVNRGTLELVPAGAAFFYAAALNPQAPVAPLARDAHGQPIVTSMDFGRELFGNLADLAIYGLPPEGATHGIPDLAAVLRVNDPERSHALWSFALSLASQASGGEAGPDHVRLAGTEVAEYEIEGMPVFLAVAGKRLVVSPSESAIVRSLGAKGERGSVLDDRAYARPLADMVSEETWVFMANAGRCLRLAKEHMPPHEWRELEPIAPIMNDTVLAVGVEHSDTTYAIQARLLGIPDVSGLVAQRIGLHHSGRVHGVAGHDREAEPRKASSEKREREVDLEAMRRRFDELAKRSPERARALGDRILAVAGEDARGLNNFAWALLTEERYAGGFDELALVLSKRSNELTDYENWYFLDTLAYAVHRKGDLAKAIELQRMAVELAADDPGGGAAQESLERYLKERERAERKIGDDA